MWTSFHLRPGTSGPLLLLVTIFVVITISSSIVFAADDQPCKATRDCTLVSGSVCADDGYCKCKAGEDSVKSKCSPHPCKADDNCADVNFYKDKNFVCDTAAGHCVCDLKTNDLSKDGTICVLKATTTIWTVMLIILALCLCCCLSGCIIVYCVCCGKKSNASSSSGAGGKV